MKLILPIGAMICTVIMTLTAIVFCLAGGANSTPAEILELKLWMVGFSLLGGGGVVAGILLLRAGQVNWATCAAFLPTVIMLEIFLIAVLK